MSLAASLLFSCSSPQIHNPCSSLICRLHEEEKKAVASGIVQNTGVTTANFGNTALVDSFAHTLALGLAGNATLTILNLEGNFLTEDGVRALAESLRGNRGLKELRVGTQSGSDSFGPECAKVVADCLETNRTLTVLVFQSQDPDIQARIDSCLSRNAAEPA